MPFDTDNSPVKDVLPAAALSLWNKVANDRLAAGAGETSAIKQAWAAVKKLYKKKGGEWVRKD